MWKILVATESSSEKGAKRWKKIYCTSGGSGDIQEKRKVEKQGGCVCFFIDCILDIDQIGFVTPLDHCTIILKLQILISEYYFTILTIILIIFDVVLLVTVSYTFLMGYFYFLKKYNLTLISGPWKIGKQSQKGHFIAINTYYHHNFIARKSTFNFFYNGRYKIRLQIAELVCRIGRPKAKNLQDNTGKKEL